ncbi:hypothetical protein [Pseudoxanthomonas mexicana]|uniref:hypothetical protein n=1 Tax=Pseudoxanthomonas mexicana TaxID=128785 RepID=UPI00398B7B94
MNLEQWNLLQPRIVDVQRLALVFAELDELKVSRLLMQAGMTAMRIKPAKAESKPEAKPETPAATDTAKGKGKGA